MVTEHPDDSGRAIWEAVYRNDEYRVRGHRFEPGDVVLDIGAHTGSFSALALEQGAGLAVAVEPWTGHAWWLHQNLIRILGFADRAIIVQAGAWRNDIPYLPRRDEPGCHCIVGADRPVAWLSLDALVSLAASASSRGRVRLVKLDCEGAEWPLLLTANPSTFERVDAWVGEYHLPACWGAAGDTVFAAAGLLGPLVPARLGQLFQDHGFEFACPDQSGLWNLFWAWRRGKKSWR